MRITNNEIWNNETVPNDEMAKQLPCLSNDAQDPILRFVIRDFVIRYFPRIDPRPSGLGYQRSIRRGFMAVDMLFGIFIVAIVTVVLVSTVRRERLAEAGLADARSAVHLAEHALLNLQHGQPMPSVTDGASLTIRPAATGTAPAGFVWAEVDAIVHGHRQSLLGVVPVASLSTPGTKS